MENPDKTEFLVQCWSNPYDLVECKVLQKIPKYMYFPEYTYIMIRSRHRFALPFEFQKQNLQNEWSKSMELAAVSDKAMCVRLSCFPNYCSTLPKSTLPAIFYGNFQLCVEKMGLFSL